MIKINYHHMIVSSILSINQKRTIMWDLRFS